MYVGNITKNTKKVTSKESLLSERALRLLSTLVDHYLKEGHPIGSKTLVEKANLELSAATVRNIMAELEDKGYLVSPHTSAGRVPTTQGLRLYIDRLITVKPLNLEEIKAAKLHLDKEQSTDMLLEKASDLLSGVTKLVGIVSQPKMELQILRLVEFLPLSESKILVILVLNEKDVQNRIIPMPKDFKVKDLEKVARFLNTQFVGKDLIEIQNQLINTLSIDGQHLDRLMTDTLNMFNQAIRDHQKEKGFVLKGEGNLLKCAEFNHVHQLRTLFQSFTDKTEILQILNQFVHADGVQIFLGDEEEGDLKGCSLVSSPYKVEDKVVGVLGVIGPTRMPYEHVISVVDLTAKLLSSALNPSDSTPYA